MFIGTFPIIASPYVVPEVTGYAEGSLKSTHENVVPTFVGHDCSKRALAKPPPTAYNAALAFPDEVPEQ